MEPKLWDHETVAYFDVAKSNRSAQETGRAKMRTMPVVVNRTKPGNAQRHHQHAQDRAESKNRGQKIQFHPHKDPHLKGKSVTFKETAEVIVDNPLYMSEPLVIHNQPTHAHRKTQSVTITTKREIINRTKNDPVALAYNETKRSTHQPKQQIETKRKLINKDENHANRTENHKTPKSDFLNHHQNPLPNRTVNSIGIQTDFLTPKHQTTKSAKSDNNLNSKTPITNKPSETRSVVGQYWVEEIAEEDDEDEVKQSRNQIKDEYGKSDFMNTNKDRLKKNDQKQTPFPTKYYKYSYEEGNQYGSSYSVNDTTSEYGGASPLPRIRESKKEKSPTTEESYSASAQMRPFMQKNSASAADNDYAEVYQKADVDPQQIDMFHSNIIGNNNRFQPVRPKNSLANSIREVQREAPVTDVNILYPRSTIPKPTYTEVVRSADQGSHHQHHHHRHHHQSRQNRNANTYAEDPDEIVTYNKSNNIMTKIKKCNIQ